MSGRHIARRGLIAGSALLLVAGEAGAAKAQELDGELIRLCAQARTCLRDNEKAQKVADEFPYGSPEYEAAWRAIYARSAVWHELCGEISDLPARTPKGIRAKAGVAAEVIDGMVEPVAASVLHDILGRV